MVCLSLVLLFGVLISSTAARRADLDFEFDEATQASSRRSSEARGGGGACGRAWCAARDVCVLRAGRAECVARQDLRPGDTLVASGPADWAGRDDDVFYDDGGDSSDGDYTTTDVPDTANKCVACERRGGGAVCGSNNRTYASLCRLDLRNCMKRGAPVVVMCRGSCPCRDNTVTRRVNMKINRPVDRASRRRRPTTDVSGCAMGALADRLLDWFAVLMDEAGATPPHGAGFPRDCKPEVRWMFTHLDTDGNGRLTTRELYALRHDDRERCLRPFLVSCSAGGAGGASGGGVGRAGWCGCLRRANRPCTALRRAHPKPPIGSYVPACDARGFYRPRQCHPALGVCWCVSPHGVETPGSRTKGAPQCEGEELESNSINQAGAEGAPDDDEDAGVDGGSGGGALLD